MEFHGWIVGLVIWILSINLINAVSAENAAGGVVRYSRELLLQFRKYAETTSYQSIPSDLQPLLDKSSQLKRKRRRGKRGGIRQRLKRLGSKLPLPTTLLMNAQSLRGKMNELTANIRYLNEYRNACVLAITETWLNESIPSSEFEPTGFTVYRSDRDSEITAKSRGGGVCFLIRDNWCRQVVVRESLCTPDIELLSISLRPFYLPREFPQLFFTVVYIHPMANSAKVSDVLYQLSQRLDTLSPDAPKFILGDFNNCSLKNCLRTYYQYVTCCTRKNKTLDKCYGNVKDAFSASTLPPLGKSDHSVVNLRPKYQRLLEREKPQIKTVKIWNEESIMSLQGCFECTLWDTFESPDLDIHTNVVSDYINFCVESVLPSKTYKLFPNNKPWVSNKLKQLLNKKKLAYYNNDVLVKRDIQREIKRQIKVDKALYKQKIEVKMAKGNLKQAWQGVRTMISVQHKSQGKYHTNTLTEDGKNGDLELANKLNTFFSRFEVDSENASRVEEIFPTSPSNLTIKEADVKKIFQSCNIYKSPGPDSICGRVLKNCAEQLSTVFTSLFQRSLDQCIVPTIWKTSIIIPFPKINKPSELSDFRPIALTSLAFKSFERLVKRHVVSKTQHILDPLQFAY